MAVAWFIFAVLQVTQPGDETLDWLMGKATPSSQPADDPATTRPATSPFVDAPKAVARVGTIVLSDGTSLTGPIRTTDAKPLKVWDEAAKKQRDVALETVKSFQVEIVWQRDEPEWRFKTSGSDEKVFTGKSYPARETRYVLQLTTGETFTGSLAAPLYVTTDRGEERVILHKRDKGDLGQSLAQLVYPVSVTFEK